MRTSETDRPHNQSRRRLFLGVVTLTLLLIALGFGGSIIQPKQPWVLDRIPARVTSADELARRAVPGWTRAEAAGLVVNLGITHPVEGSKATITLEKGWFSGRMMYILFTLRSPKGEHLTPTWVFLNERTSGRVEWDQFRRWGGFSPEGFHSLLIFDRFKEPPLGNDLKLEVRQWARVTPEEGLQETKTVAVPSQSFTLPWNPAYLAEPEAAEMALDRQPHTWLDRTVTFDRLAVAIGRMKLHGTIRLPAGEFDPILVATLRVGDAERTGKEYAVEPAGEPGLFRFTATFDGPETWPAPVEVDLHRIQFMTDRVLEWPIPWAKYREVDFYAEGQSKRLMEPADQVTIPFYDSQLRLIYTWVEGAGIEMIEPDSPPPHVRASLRIGGRGRSRTHPGMELVSPNGEVLTDFGGGGGVIWSVGSVPFQRNRNGVSAHWDREGLPEAFRNAHQFTLRYVQPEADLIIRQKLPLLRP